MRCPVCKHIVINTNRCPQCGFNQFNRMFINRDEAVLWEKEVVIPYRKKYYNPIIEAENAANNLTDSQLHLPEYTKLTSIMIDVINLPNNRNYVICGTSGTGKTTAAIYRCMQISQTNKTKVTLLKYSLTEVKALNNTDLLRQYGVSAQSFYTWIEKTFFAKGLKVSNRKKGIDWSEVSKSLEIMEFSQIEYLVIDDAELFPIELIKCLLYLAKNITVFINPGFDDMEDKDKTSLFIEELNAEAPYEFCNNLRNTKEIISVASLFAKMPSVVCRNHGPKPTMMKVDSIDESNDIIASVIARYKERSIKVVVPAKALYATFYALQNKTKDDVEIGLDRGFGIQKYVSNIQICRYYLAPPCDCDIVVLNLPNNLLKKENTITKKLICRAILSAKYAVYITYMTSSIGLLQPILENRHLCEWI